MCVEHHLFFSLLYVFRIIYFYNERKKKWWNFYFPFFHILRFHFLLSFVRFDRASLLFLFSNTIFIHLAIEHVIMKTCTLYAMKCKYIISIKHGPNKMCVIMNSFFYFYFSGVSFLCSVGLCFVSFFPFSLRCYWSVYLLGLDSKPNEWVKMSETFSKAFHRNKKNQTKNIKNDERINK